VKWTGLLNPCTGWCGLYKLLLTFVCVSFVMQPDGNGWRGPGRDEIANGFEIPATWTAQMLKQWLVSVGLGDASPVLMDGKLLLHTRKDGFEVAQCVYNNSS